jgi:hypothetical protein
MTSITAGVGRFTTGTIITKVERAAADGTEKVTRSTPVKQTGAYAKIRTRLAAPPTALAPPTQRLDLSAEIPRPREDTQNLAARVASNPARSATTTMVEKPGAIRHAEARASAVADRMAADHMAVAITNGNFKPRAA